MRAAHLKARGIWIAAWLVVLAAALSCVHWGQPPGGAFAATRWKPQLGVPEWWDTDMRGLMPSRIILLYNSGGMPAWTADRLKYYVAHVNADGVPDDWFFDTVLILALTGESQRSFEPNYGNGPGLAEDWRYYLDNRLFGGLSEMAELEKAVDATSKALSDPAHTIRVVIGIPYPDPRATQFGDLDGKSLDFSRCEDRAAAVRWYLREVSRRWTSSHFEHLRLAGFYWVREEAPEPDRPLLKLVSNLVGSQLLPFYWIPYFGSEGGSKWRELGFDIAIQQPNYFFYEVPPERIREAAKFAFDQRMGVEMEMDRRVTKSDERRERYLRYLDGGVDIGYLHSGILAWYDDFALLECGQSKDLALRKVYDETHRFVTGRYRKTTSATLAPLDGTTSPRDKPG